MGPSKLQPALLGGLAIGVLSALPLVSAVNICCCAWVLLGGALAAHLMQQNHPVPISAGDGAIVGLMAGAIGAVVGSILEIPISLALGSYQAELFRRLIEGSRNLPPEAREVLEQLQTSMLGGAAAGIGFVIGLVFALCVYSVFGLFGGLLGAVLFRKNSPPPPPPPVPTFTPPTFTPPSAFGPPPPPPPPPPGS